MSDALMSENDGHQFYHPFDNVEAARRLGDAWVVMDADWAGQVLLTCPVSHLHCDVATLRQLHCDLISIAWGSGEIDDGSVANAYGCEGEKMYAFTAPPEHGVPGGMGGGANCQEPWVHEEFVERGLKDAILAVLAGLAPRLPQVGPTP